METDNKIVDSNIENKDLSKAETDPARVKELDGMLTPWQLDAAFKALYAVSVLSKESGGKPVGSDVVAKELEIEEDRAILLIKAARTAIKNPMPGTLTRLCVMYKILSDTLYNIKDESTDPESVRFATEALARAEGMETPAEPEATEVV